MWELPIRKAKHKNNALNRRKEKEQRVYLKMIVENFLNLERTWYTSLRNYTTPYYLNAERSSDVYIEIYQKLTITGKILNQQGKKDHHL